MRFSNGFKVVSLAAIVLGGGAALILLHLDTARLERRVSALRQQQQSPTALREDNARLGELLQAHARGADAVAATTRAQIAKLSAEIAELEKRAVARHDVRQSQALQDAAALVSNRDLRSGLMRLEHAQERGQGTPAAALESVLHAVLKADEAALRRLCTLPATTRAEARELIARLPPEAQARWTPEKLALLWLTGAFTDMSALQITAERIVDAENAFVTIRAPELKGEEQVKMKQSSAGWTVIIPASAIERLEKKLRAPPAGAKAH